MTHLVENWTVVNKEVKDYGFEVTFKNGETKGFQKNEDGEWDWEGSTSMFQSFDAALDDYITSETEI